MELKYQDCRKMRAHMNHTLKPTVLKPFTESQCGVMTGGIRKILLLFLPKQTHVSESVSLVSFSYFNQMPSFKFLSTFLFDAARILFYPLTSGLHPLRRAVWSNSATAFIIITSAVGKVYTDCYQHPECPDQWASKHRMFNFFWNDSGYLGCSYTELWSALLEAIFGDLSQS